MSPDLAVLVLSTAAAVLAVVVVTSADAPIAVDSRSFDSAAAPRLVASLASALLILACSGWVVPAAVVAVGMWFAVRTWQRRDGRRDDIGQTDALASWIENLRDVLIAGDQPIGAIAATVASCPAAIRPQVRRLSAGLGRQEPDVVFRRFADDIDDPLGDLVAAGLLIAVQRGARTVAVLTALAEQARQQADRRRLVEAERAPIQREVTLLTIIMGSLVIGLLIFGRAEYLQPYETNAGQLFLGVVLAIYAALLLRVQSLARYPRPSRFLTNSARPTPRDHLASGATR